MSSQENSPNSESTFESENPFDACGCCDKSNKAACPNDATQTDCRSPGCWLTGFAVFGLCLWIAFQLLPSPGSREASRRARCTNKLKNISLALLNYENEYGRFPPAYTVDENGRPLHSWRVLVLPYLDLKDFYEDFKLDEPWDSLHNLAVARQIAPSTFRCPSDLEQDDPYTSYVMIVGPGCISEGTTSAEVKDIESTRHTILVAEIVDSDIRWNEPRDLDATTMSYKINDQEKPSISSKHHAGALVACADGSVRFLTNETKPELVKKMTQRKIELTDKEKLELVK